ncbi:glycosyltransferase family 2 protein [Vibrio sp.]|nr:glycosyltransferase family 2 protein [Vibrio sp.]
MTDKLQICVFAYNLEHSITNALHSLLTSCGKYDVEIYVMVNGCRDKTFDKVKALSRELQQIKPIFIELGDKSNAWNVFVHEYYDGHSIPVFADGDLTFEALAVENLVDFYLTNPGYNAVSSFPCLNGRSGEVWRKELLSKHQFTGNLYLLSPRFIGQVLEKRVFLPIGLIGDDSMLGYLSATSLCSGVDSPRDNIGVCTSAVFNYEPLNPFDLNDLRLYLRRRVRYSKRYFQQNDIVPKLKLYGLAAMPKYAKEIQPVGIRWLSTNVLFDSIAYLAIHREKKGS